MHPYAPTPIHFPPRHSPRRPDPRVFQPARTQTAPDGDTFQEYPPVYLPQNDPPVRNSQPGPRVFAVAVLVLLAFFAVAVLAIAGLWMRGA